MQFMLLTTVSGILKPFAYVLGKILNGIYELMSLIGIHNIAICIILFTIVIRMLMLPLTIKQQKFTKLSAKMNPELQAITEKYKDKKDEASQRKMQAETQEVYQKYGASPLGGCLPLLITFPILFALYRVIYKIPAYVNDIYTLYDQIVYFFNATGLTTQGEAANIISNFVNGMGVQNASRYVSEISKYTFGAVDFKNACIDVFAYFNASNWTAFANGTLIDNEVWQALLTATGQTADTWISYLQTTLGDNYFSVLNTSDINNLGTLLGIENLSESVKLADVGNCIYWNTYALGSDLKSVFAASDTQAVIEEILHVNKFIGGLSVLDVSGWKFPGILIPILAAGTQFIQTKLTTALNDNNQTKKQEESPMAQSMKSMTTVMPIISGVICVMLPIGVGIYWIIGTVVQIIQQIFINIYLEKTDINDIIAKSVAKNDKRLEKLGIKTDGAGNVTSVARTSTKNVNSNSIANLSKIKSTTESPADSEESTESASRVSSAPSADGKKSISDLANIMKNK